MHTLHTYVARYDTISRMHDVNEVRVRGRWTTVIYCVGRYVPYYVDSGQIFSNELAQVTEYVHHTIVRANEATTIDTIHYNIKITFDISRPSSSSE